MKRRGPDRETHTPVFDRPSSHAEIQGYDVYVTDATAEAGLPRFKYEIEVPWSDTHYEHVYELFDSFVLARSAARQEIRGLKKRAGKKAGEHTYETDWDDTFDIRWDGSEWRIVVESRGHLGPSSIDPYQGYPTHEPPYRPTEKRFKTSLAAYEAMIEAIEKSYAAHLAEEEEKQQAKKKLAEERTEMKAYMGMGQRAHNPGSASAVHLVRRLKF